MRLADIKDGRPSKRDIGAVCSTVFWYLFCHGYRFANNLFTHDSLLQIYQDDSAWQIVLGRFMQPILIFLRGGIGSPWLISCCAMIWFALGTALLIRLLDIRRPAAVFVISGILVCNAPLISANAAFIQWADFYGLAFFLSVLGICLCRKITYTGMGLGVLALTLAMGIYQAYVCVSIVLVMILLLQEAQQNAKIKNVLGKGVCYCAVLFGGALLYFLVWRIFLRAFGIWTADTYNGMASLGNYYGVSFLKLFGDTYGKVFYYFWNPDLFVTMVFRGKSLSVVWKYALRGINITVAAVFLRDLIRVNRKRETKIRQRLLQALLLLLLPAGMNFVCVISKGMEHTLMIYAFVLFYVLAADMAEEESLCGKGEEILRAAVWLCLFGVVWTNVVFANQVYLKKGLQERAAASLMTRIVAEVEDSEGYVPGVTPVAFSGSFEASPYLLQLAGFEEIAPYGMGKTALTYMGTDYAFIKYEMGILMNQTRIAGTDPGVAAMPVYPAKGSVAYVGDVLVVKISE